jgi:subtilisin
MAGRRLTSTPDDLYRDALARGSESSKSGRYLVTFKLGAVDAGVRMLRDKYGLVVASAGDFQASAVVLEGLATANALILSEIGVVIVEGEAFEEHRVSSASLYEPDSPVSSIDEEYFAFGRSNHAEYLRGFGRAASTIATDLAEAVDASEVLTDSPQVTWGLAACGVPNSQFSGQGIRVAMLDSGLDFNHPDFVGHAIQFNSFVGQPPQDVAGHGTHTTGTACGPLVSTIGLPRYGIAGSATIFAGKVLNDSLVSVGGSILVGINWAIANGCEIISISASGPPQVQPPFTQAGATALSRGLLVIAAAGNQSQRPLRVAPTGNPANSPTIMSVAALDQSLGVAPFSNGGKVEIAAPGVNVLSAFPRPTLSRVLSGTSQATPHVAGIAALYAEADPQLRGTALWSQLQASVSKLPLSAADVGAGLVQAPQ